MRRLFTGFAGKLPSSSSTQHLKVAYNDSYRILHGLPRHSSARKLQIQDDIVIFDALLRMPAVVLMNNTTIKITPTHVLKNTVYCVMTNSFRFCLIEAAILSVVGDEK